MRLPIATVWQSTDKPRHHFDDVYINHHGTKVLSSVTYRYIEPLCKVHDPRIPAQFICSNSVYGMQHILLEGGGGEDFFLEAHMGHSEKNKTKNIPWKWIKGDLRWSKLRTFGWEVCANRSGSHVEQTCNYGANLHCICMFLLPGEPSREKREVLHVCGGKILQIRLRYMFRNDYRGGKQGKCRWVFSKLGKGGRLILLLTLIGGRCPFLVYIYLHNVELEILSWSQLCFHKIFNLS